MLTSALITAATLAAPQGAPSGAAPAAAFLVEARHLVVAPGTRLENSSLLIRDGKVALVGAEIPAAAKRGLPVRKFDTVVAGFVAAHSHLSLGNDLAERISSMTADLKAADAFDPFDESLEPHARAGITTLALAPLSVNTFGGQAAIIRAGEVGEVANDAAYLKVALVSEALDQERFPTSAMGAAQLIRRSFELAGSPLSGDDPAYAVLRAVRQGQPMMIHARTHAEISRALDLCNELSITPMILGADEIEKNLARLARMSGSVVLAPLTLTDKVKRLQLPGKLEKAGVRFSFTTGLALPRAAAAAPPTGRIRGLPPGFPVELLQRRTATTSAPPPKVDPHSLRLSAALAVRHGTSRLAALAALTNVPAAQIGAAGCGDLRRGSRADFIALSGDPTDLTSRIEAVFIGGAELENDTKEVSR